MDYGSGILFAIFAKKATGLRVPLPASLEDGLRTQGIYIDAGLFVHKDDVTS